MKRGSCSYPSQASSTASFHHHGMAVARHQHTMHTMHARIPTCTFITNALDATAGVGPAQPKMLATLLCALSALSGAKRRKEPRMGHRMKASLQLWNSSGIDHSGGDVVKTGGVPLMYVARRDRRVPWHSHGQPIRARAPLPLPSAASACTDKTH